MTRFIKKSILFIIPIVLLLFSGLILPPTPRASTANIFIAKKKDSLLLHTEKPRLIFVGGSNLAFSLNSKQVKDSLLLNPINTSLSINYGLRYMLESTKQYIKREDTIVISLEYEHYYRSYDFTSEILLRAIADVDHSKIKILSFKQYIDLIRFVPDFTFSKFKPSEYYGFKESDIHGVHSYNEFGDVNAHWNLQNQGYVPITLKGNFNRDILCRIKSFEDYANKKGATVYITFPCIDEVSYNNSMDKILIVEEELDKYGFNTLGNAKRYVMPKEMMFNSIYHLNKKGVDYRTKLLIEDYKKERTLTTHIKNCLIQ